MIDRTPHDKHINVTQYHRLRELGILHDGDPIELIDGLLVLKDRRAAGGDAMTHGQRHAVGVKRLFRLERQLDGYSFHLRSQFPVTLSEFDEPEPDMAVVRKLTRRRGLIVKGTTMTTSNFACHGATVNRSASGVASVSGRNARTVMSPGANARRLAPGPVRATCWLLIAAWFGAVGLVIADEAAKKQPLETAVVKAETKFYVGGKVVATLKEGTEVEVLQLRGAWIGGRVVLDGKQQAGWLLEKDLDRATADAPAAKPTQPRPTPQPPAPATTNPQPAKAQPEAVKTEPQPAKSTPQPPTKVDAETAAAELTRIGVRTETNAENQITRIDASNSTITDSALVNLLAFPHLVELDLSSTGITDAGLVQLGHLTRLTTLYLDHTAVSDAGLAHLKELTDLEVLALHNTKVSGAGLVHLKPLTKLRVLNLSHLKIADDDLQHLKGMTGLETLALESTPLTGRGFAHLRQMRNLITLNLMKSGVTDELFQHMQGFEKLRLLYLHQTNVTHEGVDTFDGQISGLAIFR